MEATEKELEKNASTLLKDEGRWTHKLESFGAWDKETSAFSWTEKAECGKAGVSDTVAPEMPQIRITATCTAKLKIAAQHETLVLWPLLQLNGSVNQSSSVADRDRASCRCSRLNPGEYIVCPDFSSWSVSANAKADHAFSEAVMGTMGSYSQYRPFEADDVVYDPKIKRRKVECKHFDSGVQGISYAADALKHSAAIGLASERLRIHY